MSLRLILYKFAFFVLLIDSTLVTTAHCSKLLNFMLLSLFPLQNLYFSPSKRSSASESVVHTFVTNFVLFTLISSFCVRQTWNTSRTQ